MSIMRSPRESWVLLRTACLFGIVVVLISGCSRDERENRISHGVQFTDENKHDLDFLFRLVAGGDAEQSKQAIEALYQHAIGKRAPQLIEYSMPVEGGGRVGAIKSNPEHGAVLLRAIPRLIESMPEGQVDNPAWWILISIQPSCPAPNKDIWEKWWSEKGRRQFEAMASAR